MAKIYYKEYELDSNNNLVLITCSQTNKSKYLVIILNKIKLSVDNMFYIVYNEVS